MLGSRDLLFRINFTFHSSRGAGILPRSGQMHLRGKCSCLYSEGMMNEFFFSEALPSNAGVTKHPD